MPPLNKCHIGNAENLIKAAAFNRINTVPCVLCVQVQCITKLTIRYKLTETVEYLHILHRKNACKVQSLFSVCVHIIIRNIEWIHHHQKPLSTCRRWSIVMVRECKDDSTVHQREFPFARNPPQTRRKETEARRHMKTQSNKSRTIIFKGDIIQLFEKVCYSMLLCESTMQFLFLFLSLYSFLCFLLHGFQLFKRHRLHGHYFGLAKNRHRSLLSEKESLFRKNFLEYNPLSGHLCLLLR